MGNKTWDARLAQIRLWAFFSDKPEWWVLFAVCHAYLYDIQGFCRSFLKSKKTVVCTICV